MLWARAAFGWIRREPLLRFRGHGLKPWLAEDVLLGFAVWLLLPSGLVVLINPQASHLILLCYAIGLLLATIVVALFLMARYHGLPFAGPILPSYPTLLQSDFPSEPIPAKNQGDFDFHLFRWLKMEILPGIYVFLAWVPIVMLVHSAASHWMRYEHPTLTILSESTTDDRFQIAATTFFSAALVAPLVEEFFFRGILQAFLTRIFFQFLRTAKGTPQESRPICWFAITITSAIFAAIHIGQGPAPFGLFVLSIGIGYLYDRTGSLTSCVVVHFLLNAMTMFFVLARMFLGEAG